VQYERRSFLIDVLTCPCCGKRSLIAAITAPEVIVKILDHLGLPSDPRRSLPHARHLTAAMTA